MSDRPERPARGAAASSASQSSAPRLSAAAAAAERPALVAPPLGADALYDLLEACEAAGTHRHALLLRLSCLPRDMTRPHHLRLVRGALNELLMAERAQLFRLSRDPACDLVVVWRAATDLVVRECLATLRELFSGAVLSPLPQGGQSELVELLELPRDTAVLLWAIDAVRAPPPPPPPVVDLIQPALDTVSLATLEARLARADVSRFARRRDVCALEPNARFALRWEKRFLSVAELFATLAPDRAAQADPWLFRRLTRTLDHRMLSLLSATGELRDAGPFGLNLNVASILAPEFLRFDAALPLALRGRVVLDLMPADVLADPAAFLFARDFAHARGYRLLLRAVTAELLDVLPLALSGLDLLQLRWSPALEQVSALPSDPQRIVLAHADRPEAIAWGRARGILLYAGALVYRGARVAVRLPPKQPAEPRDRALGSVAEPA